METNIEFDTICRVCMGEGVYDIFTTVDSKLHISYCEMLTICTKIQPSKGDNLPRLICKSCCRQLKKSYTFSDLCEKSENKLKSKLNIKEEELDIKYSKSDIKENGDQVVIKESDNNVNDVDDVKIEKDEGRDSDHWDAEEDNLLLVDLKSKTFEYFPAENECLVKDEVVKKKRGRKPDPSGMSKKPHQCDICGKLLSTKSNLKAHKICHTDLRPYKCDECNATFRGYSALFQHRKVHTLEKPYHCEYCPKQFSRRTGLVNHTLIHTGEKKYNCELCNKKFIQFSQLSTHMKRHKGDKSFLCSTCGKGFAIKNELKVHQRIHNGEKPYACPLCPKKFSTSGNLAIHVRIHKNEVRYHCKECSRGFVTHSSYSVHMKRHKGERNYKCDCGKTFYTSSALSQHKVVHTGEKKYACKLCEKTFSQTSHRSRHFKRDHAAFADGVILKSSHFLQKFDSQLKLITNDARAVKSGLEFASNNENVVKCEN